MSDIIEIDSGISSFLEEFSLSPQGVASRLGKSASTVYARLKSPQDFKLGELHRLLEAVPEARRGEAAARLFALVEGSTEAVFANTRPTEGVHEVAEAPAAFARTASLTRNTKETQISLSLALDGTGVAEVSTGVPFFDHMLTLFARHGLFDLSVQATGDNEVDYHHMVEDTGIVLGQALRQALGDKKGIVRYGSFLLPMDECLARAVVDLSGRAYLVYQVEAPRSWFVRDFNIQLVREFFQALANTLGANIHLRLEYGDEPHHIAEALFKAFARALDAATVLDPRQKGSLPSTKGAL